jgi:hypothetical protein
MPRITVRNAPIKYGLKGQGERGRNDPNIV